LWLEGRSHDLPIYKADESGFAIVVYDVEASEILVYLEHVGKVQTEGVAQDDPVESTVPHDKDVIAFVFGKNPREAVGDPLRQMFNGLTLSWRAIVDEIRLAAVQFFRKLFANFPEGQAFPIAKVHFAKFGQGMDRHIVVLGYDTGTLHRPLEVTAINGPDVQEAKTFRQPLHLNHAGFGEVHVGMTINGEVLITVCLTVPNKI